jgi:protein-S-isoprenylcysteine O-methyltransferase Ste14
VIVPSLISGLTQQPGERLPTGGRWGGLLPLALGVPLLFWTIWSFASEGRGTLAPWDPPRKLVTGGAFRFSRNPMYIAVFLILLGEAVLLASWGIAAWLAFSAIIIQARVILSEEPVLRRAFPEEYDTYRARVPRWLLRFPWR